MNERDAYESWKQARGNPPVPDGFADRVMAAVQASHTHTTARQAVLRRWMLALLASRLGRVAIWSAGCVACIVRILFVLGILLPA